MKWSLDPVPCYIITWDWREMTDEKKAQREINWGRRIQESGMQRGVKTENIRKYVLYDCRQMNGKIEARGVSKSEILYKAAVGWFISPNAFTIGPR
jgi:hypothetical protein